jgi:hypothetical protein
MKMGKGPSIPHQTIVDYILAGNTTADARYRFGFASDNVANIRVWAAFKALNLERPRFSEERACEFCGLRYTASRRNLRTCGSSGCQEQLILKWQRDNPNKVAETNRKFRKSEKGRAANIAQHREKRALGNSGENWQRWAYGLDEISKSLRKLSEIASRNAWEYRIIHIQNLARLEERNYSNRRSKIRLSHNLERSRSTRAAHFWLIALRAIQTQESQYRNRNSQNLWEDRIVRIQASIRIGEKLRQWKKRV